MLKRYWIIALMFGLALPGIQANSQNQNSQSGQDVAARSGKKLGHAKQKSKSSKQKRDDDDDREGRGDWNDDRNDQAWGRSTASHMHRNRKSEVHYHRYDSGRIIKHAHSHSNWTHHRWHSWMLQRGESPARAYENYRRRRTSNWDSRRTSSSNPRWRYERHTHRLADGRSVTHAHGHNCPSHHPFDR